MNIGDIRRWGMEFMNRKMMLSLFMKLWKRNSQEALVTIISMRQTAAFFESLGGMEPVWQLL